ncbi:uncharacterized protein LOC123538773 isoform X2 [Mercenaria mercenaria]|uniref:uncharacterized protein LOC123538773 isoform X2 n=1 Tax=Mercenaria mercenaria TaxID=6596 RepID=UPI00234E970F|nr:uncharacterized protein LOC123538773 isoform X2 [Mercenaria mercenaria]
MQEAGDTDTEWKPVARDIRTPDYTVRNISPRKDYRFRIRAQTENGDVSEPTPPIQFYRAHVPLLKDSENALAEFKPVEYKAIFLKHPYYEQLTKYVPPTLPIHKPDMIIIDQETVELSWRPAIVAEAIRGTCNLSYTIEVRCPPSFEWRQLVTGLKVCSHTVQKLHPRIDYIFRVRAWNEYGCSDAGLPVSLYRPAVYKIEGEDLDDEEFEREWERKYGTKEFEQHLQKVPPKLPIDTPRIVTQTTDSIWFTWLPARIPAYATQTNISYVVEIREPPSTAWQRDATDLVDCQYVKEGLNPNQEYHIRVRAETEFGPSDATMPIIIRGKGSRPGSRRSSVERDERSLEDKIDLSYLDNVMAGVPPRMASSRPLSSSVGPDRLTLTWSPCRTPSYVKVSNVTYIIEKREPPGHVWTVLAKDITGHKFEVTGLNPEQDYMFRIRARNEFGLSDPTLPMTLFRDRDDYVPPRVRSRSSSRDSISMLVSKVMRRSSSIDYNIQPMEDDRSSQERIPCQPQYITTTYDTQYGVLGKKGKIQLEVRGYPLPTVHWYQGEEKIEYGGRFNAFVTPSGGITLEIKNVGLDTIGQFKCYAENASGAAVKMVNFELAEPPTVLETIKDVSILKGDSATLSCRVDGFPSPTVKWMKDWRPLADCTRTKMVNVPPEAFNLEIVQLIEEDDGLYACTVENIAGKVTVTGRLKVEIDTFPESEISIKSTPIEEHYHVLEEIGRGRYGVVRRVVEISTGRTFAANFMSMRNKAQKNFFMNEYEVLRSVSKMGGVLKLYDAFETERSLIFVTEILSEPELLEKIISDGTWTEAKVAATIRRLLAILQELAQLSTLHLDIKPSNIRMSGTDMDDIKLIGFGLSRTLQAEEDITHNYGSVGYASPEQVTNEILTRNTDMWSVGVLAYLLLSGNGPFTGSSEIEILKYMSECSWTFEGRGFEKFSKEGLDFISKLLVKDPSKRMTVEECLSHPWMSTQSETKINTEQLKQFYNAEKLQRQTEKVFTTVQLQSFAKIIHGAKALYQPAVDVESGEIIFPDCDEYGDYLDEDAWYEWQLQYLDDPDSQIFPIQDKKFTVRECRHAGAPKYSTPKQKERSDKDILDTGTGVLFRDKIQPTTFLVGEDVTFTAKVVSETGEIPVVTWYRDEQLLSDDYRADASFNPETGLAKLKIVKSKDYDAAVYKCVARIKEGRVSCEARLLLGDVASKPGRPLVTQTSGTEAFLTWAGPVSDGNAYLLGYRVDYRKEGEKKWVQGPYVTEEYALLTGLEPDSKYVFRVSVHNKYGASPFSWSSLETKTLGKDAPKVSVAADLQPLMQFSTFDKQQLILPAESRRPSLTVAEEPKINESDPNENFTFADTISKGSFGEYKLCTNKSTNQQCVTKIVAYNKDKHADITAEFELLHTLRQSNLVTVLDSYISGEQFYVIYEFLSGINIVQYLCLHKTYKEETVTRLVRQVLDALQYLEHFGIVHLNLQPSSMVMATRRRPHVKLRDFTLAQKVENDKGIKVPLAGYPDYTPPEILKGDNVTFTADLWTLGALTFTLLSGIIPFSGKNLEETLSHILFDRYSTKEMYDNVTTESVKFVGKLLSRLPRNRPTVTKCLNSSWLNLSESMVSARNSKMFKSEKLRAFSVDYLTKRSDINYSLALVDIEKLPKITSGPLVQPILSNKITNRLENLTKTKKQPEDLAESLKLEVSNLPEQPLLEKIVSKIEKDTEVKENAEKAAAEYQKVETKENASKTKEAQTVTEVEEAKMTVTETDGEQIETKGLDSGKIEEVVEYQKVKIEETPVNNSFAVEEKVEGTEAATKIEKTKIIDAEGKGIEKEHTEAKPVDTGVEEETKIEETKLVNEELKTEGTEIKKESVETAVIEKEMVKSIDTEMKKAGEVTDPEVKESMNLAEATEAKQKADISIVKETENKKETKDIDKKAGEVADSDVKESINLAEATEAKQKADISIVKETENKKEIKDIDKKAGEVTDSEVKESINLAEATEAKQKADISIVKETENKKEIKDIDKKAGEVTDSEVKESINLAEATEAKQKADISIVKETENKKETKDIDKKAGEVTDSEFKESIDLAEATEAKQKADISIVKETENKKETKDIDINILQNEQDKELIRTDKIKDKNIENKDNFVDAKVSQEEGVVQNTETEEKVLKADEDKIGNETDETVGNDKEIESKVERTEAEGEEKWHDAVAEIVVDSKNEKITDSKEKEEEMKFEDIKVEKEEGLSISADNEIKDKTREEELMETLEQTKPQEPDVKEKLPESLKQAVETEIIKQNVETPDQNEKSEEGTEDSGKEKIMETYEVSHAAEQTVTHEEHEEHETKSSMSDKQEDSTDGKETAEQLQNTEGSDQKKEIESVEKAEVQVKEILNEASQEASNNETLNQISDAEVSKGEHKELEEISEKLESVESNVVQQKEIKEVVEEKLESVKIDKKEITLLKNENTESETIKEIAVSEKTESTKMISELAETTAEEIKNAALEEVATILKASEESEQTGIQLQKEEETDQAAVDEEAITAELKESSKEAALNKTEVDVEIEKVAVVADKMEKSSAEMKSGTAETVKDEIKTENILDGNASIEKTKQDKKEHSDKTEALVIEQKEISDEQRKETVNKDSESVVDTTDSVVETKTEKSDIKSCDNVNVENEMKTESVEKMNDSLQDKIKSDTDVKLEEEYKIKEGKTGIEDAVSDVKNDKEKESTKIAISEKESLIEAASEKLSEVVESASTDIKEKSVSSVTEEGTEAVSAKSEINESVVAESIIAEQESSIENISTSVDKESISESKLKLADAEVKESVENQVTESTSLTATDETATVTSTSVKEETLSASVSEQVDGVTTETVSVIQKHETLTGGETLEGIENVTTTTSSTEEHVQKSSSVVERSESGTVTVTQKRETLTTGGETSESVESISTVTTAKEESIQESTSVLESAESKEVSKEQRQETLISGSMESNIKENIEMVSTSLIEESLVESAISSSLETAKVTESRETIREFMTNDLEIEEMKKELLEDLEISSADCGKYLMGSHEDISSIKEKIEKKPDEEEIEKETTNRYIDDALMFC